jgi:hypothetical protein
VVEGDALVLSLRPIIDGNAEAKTGAGLDCELGDLLEDLGISILEHGRNNLLLERGKVLSYLAIDVVVLLPKLVKKIKDNQELSIEDSGYDKNDDKNK